MTCVSKLDLSLVLKCPISILFNLFQMIFSPLTDKSLFNRFTVEHAVGPISQCSLVLCKRYLRCTKVMQEIVFCF